MSLSTQHKYFHWLYFNRGKRLSFLVVLSVFFWLFLSLAQPFGIHSEWGLDYLVMMVWILPIASIWLLVFIGMDQLFAKINNRKNIKSYKTDLYLVFIKVIIVIHLIFIIRGISCNWICLDLLEYGQLWFACILFFSLIYVPFTLYAKFLYVKETFGRTELSNMIKEQFTITDGKEKISLDLAQVTFFKSDDNYIDVNYTDDEQKSKSITFRSTMKEMEEKVGDFPQFIRVHRSYIVNMNYFESFNTSSGAYQLTIKQAEKEIQVPVSRKYKDAVSQLVK